MSDNPSEEPNDTGVFIFITVFILIIVLLTAIILTVIAEPAPMQNSAEIEIQQSSVNNSTHKQAKITVISTGIKEQFEVFVVPDNETTDHTVHEFSNNTKTGETVTITNLKTGDVLRVYGINQGKHILVKTYTVT